MLRFVLVLSFLRCAIVQGAAQDDVLAGAVDNYEKGKTTKRGKGYLFQTTPFPFFGLCLFLPLSLIITLPFW